MDLDYEDYEGINDFDSTYYSIRPVSSYNGSYQFYNPYNSYYSLYRPYRTVPPFYDTTTHREHFTWKHAPSNRRYQVEDDRATLPPFEDETTHRAHFPGHYILGREYEEDDFTYDYEEERIPLNETSTHRRDFTPKPIEIKEIRSKSVDSVRRPGPRMEYETTHKADYSNKASTCPVNHLNIKQGRRDNGHVYFRQRTSKNTKRVKSR
ncbi:unnamed protein product [Bursaphelenchus xylophilus]|uniref:(pine wood nematode) hypothetical protein n=1 Tax=Bursaphelenchus xylophilus TaxID=6326 RepID=A0A1I7SDA0_BURXY|nr:unnamed protein product [Bursaphelenchus xylophilus]CAG9130554.1 unnamed protein product [Bursaphelenchus xylophilus]